MDHAAQTIELHPIGWVESPITDRSGAPKQPDEGAPPAWLVIDPERSPVRPNPISLHHTEVLAVDGNRVQVAGLEAIDGTPILDLEPRLGDER